MRGQLASLGLMTQLLKAPVEERQQTGLVLQLLPHSKTWYAEFESPILGYCCQNQGFANSYNPPTHFELITF
jgi:hypothetical protein